MTLNKIMNMNNPIHLLPYTGVGTGIMRALNLESGMKMVNDEALQEFVVTFARPFKDDESDRADDRDVRDNSHNNSDVVSDSDRDSDRVDDRDTDRVPFKEYGHIYPSAGEYGLS